MFARAVAVAALGLGLITPVAAQDLQTLQVKAIGSNGTTPVSIYDEVPFWTETIPEASGGKITAQYTPVDQMGIDDKTMLRLLKLGVMDFGSMDISKMSGDDPVFEGCDLAGLALTPANAREACEAWRPVIDRQLQEDWGVKLLAIGGNTPQVFWCRGELDGLDTLRGKKIRVFNNTMRDFLSGLDATAISMAFAEVIPALNNGVVDCAVTGSLSGNTAGWNEVIDSIYPMSLGWSINILAVNLKTWDSFDEATQEFFLEQAAAYEDKMWETLTKATNEAENCNTGTEPCTLGKMASSTVIPVADADSAAHTALVENAVLAGWAGRCGADCVTEWNETVGKALDLEAPLP
ncbi:TRAP transporter substrate-binding protein [Acuticoccus sp. MNP-M23]|uniref:TRAP transporter substrate-binding protein n=1 Tax=Acuticoccus sp. MNP-M23 TaxID=3072793 RepID=UPI0028166497|nr:TRAP transporter substrate-binding protein [Acuticoccus sp. MNP-M23]WMS42223.1 TRAP transporter substrate-binding protein [Acuticoccus sp. MNP-M23]